MSTEENKAVVRRRYEEWNKRQESGDLGVLVFGVVPHARAWLTCRPTAAGSCAPLMVMVLCLVTRTAAVCAA